MANRASVMEIRFSWILFINKALNRPVTDLLIQINACHSEVNIFAKVPASSIAGNTFVIHGIQFVESTLKTFIHTARPNLFSQS